MEPVSEPSKHKRRGIGINRLITSLIFTCILFTGALLGYLALELVEDEKSTDTWGLVYLTLEGEIRRIQKQIEKNPWTDNGDTYSMGKWQQKPPKILMELGADGPKVVFGNMPNDFEGLDKLTEIEEKSRFIFWNYAGQDYLVRDIGREEAARIPDWPYENKRYLLFWEVSTAQWLSGARSRYQDTTVYLTTKGGQLLYSNVSDISSQNVHKRQLVKAFIKAPLRRAQMEVMQEKREIHGVFNEIEGTNLVVFLEIPTNVTLAPVRRISSIYGFFLVVVIILTVGLAQWPIRKLISPLRVLVRMARRVGEGDYAVETSRSGIGEIDVLNLAFSDMAHNLAEKEKAIEAYIVQQKEAVRLEAELEVAHSIQENLLPKDPVPKESGLDVAIQYQAAEECAGDWYHQYYNEKTGETILAVADVAGHGAGSAMFTAIIAAMFEDAKMRHPDRIDALAFLHRLNEVFSRIGRNQWHTTFCIIQHFAGDMDVLVTAAGATPLIVCHKTENGYMVQGKVLPSDVVGILPDPVFTQESLPFRPGSNIVIHTDGITEALNDKKKQYGFRRLKNQVKSSSKLKSKDILRQVLNNWHEYCKDEKQEDDFCLVALKHL